VANLARSGRTLWRVSGVAEVETAGSSLMTVIRTGAEQDSTRRLMLHGRRFPTPCNVPDVFLGVPQRRQVSAEGHVSPVGAGALFWRAGGRSSDWVPFEASVPRFGAFDLALVRDGHLMHRLRLAVVPEAARVSILPGQRIGGTITLEGFTGAEAAPLRSHGVEVMSAAQDSSSGRFTLDVVPVGDEWPADIPIALHWPDTDPVILSVPFPMQGGGFVDGAGRWLRPERDRLTLDRLVGVRARGGGVNAARPRFFAWLNAPEGGSTQARICRDFEGDLHLNTLRRPFLRALSSSRSLDAELRLVVQTISESRQLRLGRFEADLVVEGETIRLAQPGEDGETIEIVARPVADPFHEEVPLRREEDDAGVPCWRFPILEGAGTGTWLVYGRREGRHVFRPTIAVIGEPQEPSASEDGERALSDSFLIADKHRRRAAIEGRLEEIVLCPLDPDWALIARFLNAYQGRLPLTTFDVFDVMARRAEFLPALLASVARDDLVAALQIDDEMPFVWNTIGLGYWIAAFQTALDLHVASFIEKGLNEEPARTTAMMIVEDSLALIEESDPSLVATVWFVRTAINPAGSKMFDARPEREVVQGVMRRNADHSWPNSYDFQRLSPRRSWISAGMAEHCRMVLDAPYAAAFHSVHDVLPKPATVQALRQARDFDPEYFQDAFPLALCREFAASENSR